MNDYEAIEQVLEDYCGELPEIDASWPPRVRQSAKCMHAYWLKPKCTVGWIIQECDISIKSFAAQFERYMGLKPKAYMVHHRIEVGKCLLQQTEAEITTIALSVGFNSLSAFDKRFEDSVGVRPSVWRGQNREG